jgi:hypothetical protein
MIARRLGLLASALVLTGATLGTVHAQPAHDPFAQDAQAYAQHYRVDVSEALRRLHLQSDLGELNAALETQEAATFAGMWIEHSPQYRVVAQFTRDGARTLQRYTANTPFAGLIELREARVSYARLIVDQQKADEALSKAGVASDSLVDVKQNRVELRVLNAATAQGAVKRAGIKLPETAELVQVERLATPTADIYGGLSTPDCTLGFAVRNSAGTRGVTTAGHCNNTQSYAGVNLPLQREAVGGSYDIQWHTAPGFTVRNLIYTGSGTVSITGARFVANQVIGSTVCNYGKVTRYKCGEIYSKTARTGPYVPNSSPTFVLVRRSGVDMTEYGDSGGPWFVGSLAYGTQSGQAGISTEALYMPIDYLSGIGVSLLTQ